MTKAEREKRIEELRMMIEEMPYGKGNHLTFAIVTEWCQLNKRVLWLKKNALTPIEEEGKEPRLPSIMDLRPVFYAEFFPHLLPAPKPVKKTVYDIIYELEVEEGDEE